MEKKIKKKKFDCWNCRYRGSVAGSAHICCNHPSLAQIKENPMLEMMAIFASVGRSPAMNVNSKELNIKGNLHGIKSGWFNFPFNFDPVWLENCDGFENK